MSTKLEQYREEIVSINNQILELLSKRGELAQKIGEEKIKQGTKSLWSTARKGND